MLKRGGVARFALFVGLTLEGCGDSSSSRHSATGGAVGSASGGAVGFGGASATAGASGAAGNSGMPGTGGIAGAGMGAGGQAGTTIVEPVPSIAGDWALIGFEDPVAVQLSQGDGVLEGVGCIAGLPRPQVTDPLFPCRPIVGGKIVGTRIQFGFGTPFPNEFYATDVTASAAGDRMTGLFKGTGPIFDGPVTWLRITSPNTWLLGTTDQGLRAAVRAREQRYDLNLAAESSASAQDFVRNRPYNFVVADYSGSPLVYGELGAFWATEMSWRDAEQILVIGPVSATVPELPVGLTLRFGGLVLVEVEATTPSGARYRFVATPQM